MSERAKVVVITGGGRGIGRAHALRFAAEGYHVVVNDSGVSPLGRDPDPSVAAAVGAEIEAAGGVAIADGEDVSRRDGAERLFARALERFGRVDAVVSNVGVLPITPFLEIADDEWDSVIASCLRSTFLTFQIAARHMVERGGGGRLIAMSSVVGLTGNAGLAHYGAAKAGIYGLVKTLSAELKAHDVTVNVVTPMAYTRLTAELPQVKTIPNAAEALSPDFVADVSLFLASDAAGAITGQVIDVGGAQVSCFRLVQGEGSFPQTAGRWTTAELEARWEEIASK